METIIGFIGVYIIMLCLNKILNKLINWLIRIFKKLVKRGI